MRSFVNVARELGIEVGGFEVTPNCTTRILTEQAASKGPEGDFEKWFSKVS